MAPNVPWGVSALGTLEPKSRIVRVSAPTSPDGARVERMFVSEGDWVEEGTVVAHLDTFARRAAALRETNARLSVAVARLEQVRAGSKAGAITSREAQLSRARANFRHAASELNRAEHLIAKSVLTTEELDRRRYQFETAGHDVVQAEGELTSVREVRDVDLRLAQAEVDSAAAGAERAQADLDAAQLRAPLAGQILKIVAQPGEQVGPEGVLELGDTSEMDAVAEVYEADLPQLRVEQRARIHVPSLKIDLHGQVVRIGQRIGRKRTLDNDPIADTDARVAEVRIRLDRSDGSRVAGLSNARVQVVLEPCQKE